MPLVVNTVLGSLTRLARSCQYAGAGGLTGQWKGGKVGASEMHQYGVPRRLCAQVLAGKDPDHNSSTHMPMAVSVHIGMSKRFPEGEKMAFPS